MSSTITRRQATAGLVTIGASSFLLPRTPEELAARNRALVALESSGEGDLHSEQSRRVHSALRLPDYAIPS